MLSVSVFACLLVQALPDTSLAQTGKLAGTVTDGATGDPIPGATVVLEGTTLGTATDAEGHYFLIGVRPGTYSVRFSFVGYSTKVIENVLVTSDRTKSLDVTLETEVVEGAEVVVEAVRPVVDPNQTTSRTLVTSEEISRMPVRSLEDVISKTANSFNGYLRGSRQYETKTVLEGVDISDSWFQTAPAGNGDYGGNTYHNTNKAKKVSPSSFDINPDGVSEVSVNTGATEAKYTTGSGGVVTVSLREDRGPIHGSVSARVGPQTNRPGPDSLAFYQEITDRADPGETLDEDLNGDGVVTGEEAYLAIKAQVAARAASGDAVAQRRLAKYTWTPDKYAAGEDPEYDFRGNLGGSITDVWHFSANVRFLENHGYMPNEFHRRMSGQLKTTYEISEKTSLTGVGLFEDRGYWGSWNNREFRDFFRYNLESVAQNDGGNYMGSLKLTQVMNDHSYLNVQAFRTYWRDRYGYPDDNGNGFVDQGEDGDFIDFFDYTDGDGNGRPDVVDKYVDVDGNHDKMFEQNISDSFCDSGVFLPNGLRYRLGCPVVYSEDTKVTMNGVKVDYANQVNTNHFIQLGAEGKFRTIDYKEAYGVDGLGFTLNGVREPWIPSDWSRSPKEFGIYASDRMEYAGLIVNLGLRVDMIDRDTEEVTDYFFPFKRDTVTIDGIDLARNFTRRGDATSMDVFFNPSIGVSHPIGSNASMYFSYKHATQEVPYHRMYQKYGGNNSNSQFFQYTEPNIDPIVSDNFELGIQWELSPGWGLDVNAYSRAIENFTYTGMSATQRVPEGEYNVGIPIYTWLTDFGYADSRGLELVLRRAPLQMTDWLRLGVTASYTYASVEGARGAGNNQSTFIAAETDDPTTSVDDTKELPFDNTSDFRHFAQDITGSRFLDSGFDRRHRGVLRMSAVFPYEISLGINGTIESGILYPRAIIVNERDRSLLTGPTNHEVDVRLEKAFDFNQQFGLDVFIDVTNVFDHDNVVAYDDDPQTGSDVIFEKTGVPGQRLVESSAGQALYGPARNVFFGTRVRF